MGTSGDTVCQISTLSRPPLLAPRGDHQEITGRLSLVSLHPCLLREKGAGLVVGVVEEAEAILPVARTADPPLLNLRTGSRTECCTPAEAELCTICTASDVRRALASITTSWGEVARTNFQGEQNDKRSRKKSQQNLKEIPPKNTVATIGKLQQLVARTTPVQHYQCTSTTISQTQ